MKKSSLVIKSVFILFLLISLTQKGVAQADNCCALKWKNVSAQFGPLPNAINVFESEGTFNDSAFKAFYVAIDTKSKGIELNTDTTLYRRLTPQAFYEKLNQPLVVVNSSFFEFKYNTNVNVVVKNGKPVSYNIHNIPGKGKDTLTYTHVLGAALGADKKGHMDIGYTYTDSSADRVEFQSNPMVAFKDSNATLNRQDMHLKELKPWKVQWANGGGPVLMRDGAIHISNNEEKKFAGKAILDLHPRTAMGYKQDGTLIIMAVQGRMKGIAVGATLNELAILFQQLGCYEAINLDGGGSSCLLVNGKETIKPSDPTGQRPVPAVFYVK